MLLESYPYTRCWHESSVVGAIIVQMIYDNRLSLDDPSYSSWPVVIAAQAVQALTITTACFMYLKPFLGSLESGLLRSDDLRRRGVDGDYVYASSKSGSRKNSAFKSLTDNTPSFTLRPLKHMDTITTVHAEEQPWNGDVHSMSSQTQIINYTTSYTVGSERVQPGSGIGQAWLVNVSEEMNGRGNSRVVVFLLDSFSTWNSRNSLLSFTFDPVKGT